MTAVNPFGYDYGTKPIVVVAGDTEFPGFLTSKDFVALAYDQVPGFGLLVNPPRLAMVFRNIEAGRKCFTHFKRWSGDTEDGDAVRIGFVEFNDGGYGVCISQDIERLIAQMVPEIQRDELELRIMNVGHLKSFPRQSEAYRSFKSAVQNSPFVLAAQEVGASPVRELAMRKREVFYFREDDLPKHSIEYALVQGKGGGEREVRRKIPPEIRFGREGIAERRRVQMSRFFPVTIERLTFNNGFMAERDQLIREGYRAWQVLQAACNISLRCSAPELFIANNEDPATSVALNVLEFLLANHETPARILPPDEDLTAAKLKTQIHSDVYQLIRHVTESDCEHIKESELQSELERLGLSSG